MTKYFVLGLALLSATATCAQQTRPLYQDRQASTEARVQDLLGRMTTAEKVGQLSTLLGWEMYQKEGRR
jgi:beta-glucosidase